MTLHTSLGDIVVTVDVAGAPMTAEQFLALAKAGYFDDIAVYRIEPGFVIQLGDLDAKLQYRDPKRPPVPLETETNRHVRGAVGLARADEPGSGLATFYIDMADNPHLNATPGAGAQHDGLCRIRSCDVGHGRRRGDRKSGAGPEGGPFPGRLPKVPVIVSRTVVTKAE